MSSIIHHEDSGSVYSSIKDDGKILHWCDKCGKMWLSQEKAQENLSEVEKKIVTSSKEVLLNYYNPQVRNALQAFLAESKKDQIEVAD